ncbi:IS110 family transposase, partial [Streptomyces cyaneofuscatus]
MTAADASDTVDQDVFGGVDSHADTIHVAVISDNGGHLADAEFATTAPGYAAALAFLAAHGQVVATGVEGTASYGAGFTRAARAHGFQVVEVNRPDRAERRRTGKSDAIDAYAAARAALSGRATSAPKDDTVAGIRALHNAARSAVKARTAALNQIGNILITAPDAIRAKYGHLKGTARTEALAHSRPAGDACHTGVLTALKSLARRVMDLTAEHDTLTRALNTEVTTVNPGLRAAYGVGPDTAAQLLITAGGNPERMRTEASFAALCGAAPVPASSGRTNRHRLSRGGDRAANAALYRIALTRMSGDARTRAYVTRQTAAGRTKKGIIRMLKRAIAREMFRCLT